MGNTFERIYAVVRQIPKGRVATYGQVASLAGNPRWSRVVGYALHVNPSRGRFRAIGWSTASAKRQGVCLRRRGRARKLLEEEGVRFTQEGRVDLNQYLWME